MEVWAEINLVFGGGWPPSEMDNMALDELLQWHQIAIEKHQQSQPR
ncbi:GpE family phage tail protein [Alteromonas sp. a30]|nr:GpE family phage tail protein [Alteromonas sp. a30]MCY7297539.1 GpE family phage tail protein [Alteromonas sp. a30]